MGPPIPELCARLDSLLPCVQSLVEHCRRAVPAAPSSQPPSRSTSPAVIAAASPPLPQPVAPDTPTVPFWKRAFPWLTADVVTQVYTDTFVLNELHKLARPDLRPDSSQRGKSSGPKNTPSGSTTIVNGVSVEVHTFDPTFVRSMPNVEIFTNAFTTYLTLRGAVSQDRSLVLALGRFLQKVTYLSTQHPWPVVTQYILNVFMSLWGSKTSELWLHVCDNTTVPAAPAVPAVPAVPKDPEPPKQAQKRRRGNRSGKSSSKSQRLN